MDKRFLLELRNNFFLTLLALLFAAVSISAQSTAAYPPGTELDENGVPVLIKHLPDSANAQKRAAFVTDLPALQKLTGNRAILDQIEFIAGTEAATASYEKARVVVVEFPNPQLSVEADRKIAAKLHETPQPLTQTAYRRIGNYSVFVFDAPDEATANTLLEQVTYEKDVQWLGGNPFPGIAAQRRERRDLATAGSIIVTVIQTAGLAIVGALGIGALCGTMVFAYRRRKQNGTEAFSDAGGMLRLNLDELTAPAANRLLEDGKSK